MELLEFLIFVSKREKYQRELLSDTHVHSIYGKRIRVYKIQRLDCADQRVTNVD